MHAYVITYEQRKTIYLLYKHSKICSTNMYDRLLCAHSGIGEQNANLKPEDEVAITHETLSKKTAFIFEQLI